MPRAGSLKSQQRRLRDQMLARGLSHGEIASEMGRAFRMRPRTAWRAAYGWTLDDVADRCNAVIVRRDRNASATITGPRVSEWESWPFGGRKPTVKALCLLAEVFESGSVLALVDFHDREHLPPSDMMVLTVAAAEPTVQGTAHLNAMVTPAEGMQSLLRADGSGSRWVDIGEVVMAAANESGESAAAEAGRVVPGPVIEQVHQELARLARRYSAIAPLPFLEQVRLLREHATRLVGRTRRPGQLADLHVAAGRACALMAVASFDLAVWPAAIEQAHAAMMYAEMAGDQGLHAWALGTQGLISYWRGQPTEAAAVISAGLELAPPGTARVRLQSIAARAWSYLGQADLVREAIGAADRERDLAGDHGDDELHDVIGGEFGFGPARQAMCLASALLRIGDADGAAVRAAQAIRLYEADRTGSLVDMTARADLAHAEIARGELDAAEEALAPVWDIQPAYRRYGLVDRLESLVAGLAGGRYGGTGTAGTLAERLTAYTSESAPRVLPAMLEPPGS